MIITHDGIYSAVINIYYFNITIVTSVSDKQSIPSILAKESTSTQPVIQNGFHSGITFTIGLKLIQPLKCPTYAINFEILPKRT